MKIKRIGIILLIALFIFGCNPEEAPKEEPKGYPETASKVTITYNMDGGTPDYVAVNVDKNSPFGLQYPSIPTKSGFIFDGWYAENDTTYSTKYEEDTLIKYDITLKARWLAECTITFNTNGGSAAPSDIKIAEGSSMDDKYPPVPTKTSNTFAGWYADSDTSYSNVYTKTTTINADINLKARWTSGAPPTYTVTFNAGGGSPTPSNINVPQGAIIGNLFPTTEPTNEGYIFTGWYNGNVRYDKNTAVNSNVTLTAKWESASVQINSWNGFSMPSGTSGFLYEEIKGKTNVLFVKPSASQYEWNVLSYSLTPYIGKSITITMSMDVWIDTAAKIAWQINNGSDDAWGGAWKVIAGNNAPDSEIATNTWVHLEGSATGTPATGNNNGNLVYLSGGGGGGQLENNPIPIYFANFVMTINDGTAEPDPYKILLTVGGKKDLKSLLGSPMNGKTITWSSGDASKVYVDSTGNVTSNITVFSTDDGNQKYTQGPAKAEVTITAKAADNTTQTFTVVATTEAQEYIMDLPPLKAKFPANILIGNIATTGDAGTTAIINQSLIRHFNALTSENDMKPSSISTGEGAYNWTNADKFVNAATASGFKVIGHTLLWHSQIPTWQQNMASATKEVALAAMKKYITDVVTHFKGKIYSWDVLNEVFPDGVSASADWKNSMRQENPWYKAIGSDFVYEGFIAARLADPNAILYYNDYNTDQTGKATMIRNMVRDVNQRFKTEYPNQTRLLIEGIGMQEHHNLGVSASNVRAALNLFKPLGVKIAVSEIDVLGQDWGSFNSVGQGANKQGSSTVTNNGLMTQASLYKQYMDVYKDFTDIIERISIWGITDNNSWRSAGLPLLFDANGKAKPAYYKFVEGIPTP